MSIGTWKLSPEPAIAPTVIPLAAVVETEYYTVVIDPVTAAITSLKLRGSEREMLAGPANVVVAERLHPRALLTPFTDDAELTPADRRTYTKRAKAERVKGFQRVSVRFGDRPSCASALQTR